MICLHVIVAFATTTIGLSQHFSSLNKRACSVQYPTPFGQHRHHPLIDCDVLQQRIDLENGHRFIPSGKACGRFRKSLQKSPPRNRSKSSAERLDSALPEPQSNVHSTSYSGMPAGSSTDETIVRRQEPSKSRRGRNPADNGNSTGSSDSGDDDDDDNKDQDYGSAASGTETERQRRQTKDRLQHRRVRRLWPHRSRDPVLPSPEPDVPHLLRAGTHCVGVQAEGAPRGKSIQATAEKMI